MNPFFIIVFLIHLLVNTYLFIRGWQAIPPTAIYRSIYIVFFLIVFSSFFIGMIGRNTLPLGLQKVLLFVGTTWLIAMLYLTIYFLATDLTRIFIPALLTRQVQVVSGALLVIVLLLIGNFRYNHPAIETLDLSIRKKTNDGRKEMKIVAVSDVHLGTQTDKKRLQKYVEMINAQHPDLILIGGDLIDNNVRPLIQEKMEEELYQLQAPLGIYLCPGNHEYFSGIPESEAFLRKTKIHFLRDTAVCVDRSFWIIGRDDRTNPHRKSLAELVAETDPLQPLFLLDHQPYHLEEAEQQGIDLQFSGHTHNGQIWPGNLLVKKIYEVGYGYKQKGNTHVYTSSGLSIWGPPYRIGTQSELMVFNIHFE